MTNSTWPLWTTVPSTKLMDEMYPDTRGRTSTWSTALKRPLNVSESVTVREMTRATVTWGAGGGTAACWAAASRAQPDTVRAATTAAAASETKAMDRLRTMRLPICVPWLDVATLHGSTTSGDNSCVDKPFAE